MELNTITASAPRAATKISGSGSGNTKHEAFLERRRRQGNGRQGDPKKSSSKPPFKRKEVAGDIKTGPLKRPRPTISSPTISKSGQKDIPTKRLEKGLISDEAKGAEIGDSKDVSSSKKGGPILPEVIVDVARVPPLHKGAGAEVDGGGILGAGAGAGGAEDSQGDFSAIKAVVGGFKAAGARQGSRKNPERASDAVYAQHHLSASSLSVDTRVNPMESHKSQHIFVGDTFESLALHPKLVSLLSSPRSEGGLGLSRPTRVQSKAVGTLISGSSVFIKAQTGSGKTLAYLLPLVQRLQSLPDRPSRTDGTLGLVLAPTRELCSQIFDVLVRLVQPFIWLVPGCVSGGERRKSEKSRLRKVLWCNHKEYLSSWPVFLCNSLPR